MHFRKIGLVLLVSYMRGRQNLLKRHCSNEGMRVYTPVLKWKKLDWKEGIDP